MMAENGYNAMYVDERAEKAFEAYARNILEHVNPYTGKRYADEEAIGLYEIINENGFVEAVLSNGLPGVAEVGKSGQASSSASITAPVLI